ncbi:MAG: hypothetical protein P4L59_19170 [Desulfosporosinus sp.]|nr:hypothetical protein [Desulfosporosinus sp.]
MRKSKLYLDTVNIRTINKVQAVNKLVGYSDISILPPSMLVEGDETDDQ